MCRICTSISWSMATISDGWPMRPQLMSVMCSRPSMPPRSTNAPNSAMFLTTPLRSWPTSSVFEQLLLLLGPLVFDQRAAADDDVAAGFVDLEHEALDRAADVIADVGRPADIDLAGRQEHVDADVDQQAALDLARDHAGDDVVLLDGLHDLHPLFDLLALRLESAIMPRASRSVLSSTSSISTLTCWPICGGSSSSSHSLRGMMPSLL